LPFNSGGWKVQGQGCNILQGHSCCFRIHSTTEELIFSHHLLNGQSLHNIIIEINFNMILRGNIDAQTGLEKQKKGEPQTKSSFEDE
jgi:hypothetical protein